MTKSYMTPEEYFRSKEEVEAFKEWAESNEFVLSHLNDYTREELIWLATLLYWGRHKVLQELDDEIAATGQWEHFSAGVGGSLEITAIRRQKRNSRLGQQTKKNLSSGRDAASRKRKLQAKELENKLAKAVGDLFQNGAGWKMSNKQVGAFLSSKGFGQHFTDATLLRKIAPIIAQVRKTESPSR